MLHDVLALVQMVTPWVLHAHAEALAHIIFLDMPHFTAVPLKQRLNSSYCAPSYYVEKRFMHKSTARASGKESHDKCPSTASKSDH